MFKSAIARVASVITIPISKKSFFYPYATYERSDWFTVVDSVKNPEIGDYVRLDLTKSYTANPNYYLKVLHADSHTNETPNFFVAANYLMTPIHSDIADDLRYLEDIFKYDIYDVINFKHMIGTSKLRPMSYREFNRERIKVLELMKTNKFGMPKLIESNILSIEHIKIEKS